ncbi:related to ALG6 - glucosyltransferase [Melanopsichium pennsylvanicum]|uniref:dolichyl-P-Glc:Man9GlcNAc2-PP-dolichol alpha-1,3-glucosyltransferase n=2 Tax=Melanopsichium pennsylvanicum TaxID=63383 RepID=A0AAJ4XLB4_9BASI|nr:related to ALG6-glucosyltransferase [Melanopsichium pennsylvanicum 4]SNX84228.1 related to ALG6 - glucosyltransferase [Melanopsichium pennsylvanicum]
MSRAFDSWQERPDLLGPTTNGIDDRATQDASATHPNTKWIQDHARLNSDTARTDQVDQFGIPIHPSQSSSSRLTSQSSSKRDPSLPRSPSNASPVAFKPSSFSKHLLEPSSSSRAKPYKAYGSSPSPSWHVLTEDPSPSASRIVAKPDDQDQDQDQDQHESISLLLGQSKRRRGRKDSYSSFGSSVLPAPLFASGVRYNAPHAGSNNGLSANRQGTSAKHGRSTYPPSNHSGAAPASRHLAPNIDTFAQHQSQTDALHSRQRVASRPSGFDLDDWLRTSQASAALKTSPSLGTIATFDRADRSGRAGPLSEAGTRPRRQQGGSTSGLSAGVLSAGPESPRSRRKASATSRRDGSAYSSLSSDHPAFMASQELSREAGNRSIDTIEEWRVKSIPQAAEANTTTSSASVPAGQPERRRRKSSVKGTSRPVSMDGPPPPLPIIPPTFAAESVTSKTGRRRRKGTETSLAGLLSPDRASTSQRKLTSSAASPAPPPALRDLYALSGIGSQAETPIRRLIRWLAKEQMKTTIFPLVLLVAFLVRWIVARGDWSGKGVQPMHGDFEAQRHWIELTLHLPTSKWYFYDLQYWGLDYPPLTAWVSLLCGYASRLFPTTSAGFALESSRGNEDPATSVFMRATVIVGDLLIYLPAISLFLVRKLEGRGRRTQAIALFSILLQPALILIDHGHFQYNSIMLGFSAACFALLHTTLPNPDASSSSTSRNLNQAVADLSRRLSYEYIAAAGFFCLSLSFKQMALYYAPAVFAVMLGRCVGLAKIDPERGLTLFIGLGLAVVITFGIVFAPWLTSLEQIGQVVYRIFPVARGLFEDKVSNVWCFLSVLPLPQKWKLKNVMESSQLAKMSLGVTLVAILPGCWLLFWAASTTAEMEMMVAQEIVSQKKQSGSADKTSIANMGVTGSATAPTIAASQISAANRSRRTPSVIGSVAGAPARSEIESLLAGSVSKSLSGRCSQAGPPDIEPSLHSDYHLSKSNPSKAVASTLPSPTAQMLPYGLLSVSSAFFLFGFQTHEKSILLPLLPMTLMLGAKGDTWGGNIAAARDWEWGVWFNNIATFSLYPLLKKDGQSLQYLVLLVMWNWFIGNLAIPLNPLQSAKGALRKDASFFRRLSTLTYIAAIGLHGAEMVLPRVLPDVMEKLWSRYPDIFPVLNVLLTTPCFGVVFVWALIRQFQVGFANGFELSFNKSARRTSKSS